MLPRSRALTRWLCGVFVGAALAGPGLAEAAPGEGEQLGEGDHTANALSERAGLLETNGHYAEAAVVWEALVDASDDESERMLAYMDAAHAWMAAFDSSAAAEHRESAAAILRRALADVEIDPRAREEFAVSLEEIERAADADRPEEPRVALLDPRAGLAISPAAYGALPSSIASDSPRRSPLTIAGGVVLALAAPAVGGFVYAAIADRQIVREVRGMDDYDPVKIGRLKDEAQEVRAMAIGLGVASTVLAGAGIGLVIAGHRRESLRSASITLLPHATAGQGCLALVGRF